MTAVALALAAALAVCAVLYVARGFLRRPAQLGDDLLEPVDRARLAALDERDRALAALQELEFDHRTGKVSDEDYAALLGSLRQAAARALVALDELGAGEPHAAAAADGAPAPTAPGPSAAVGDEPTPHDGVDASAPELPVDGPGRPVAGPAAREP